MNQQQLQNARTALWRQNGQPLLTQDDAVAWLGEMGICLFLPRHAQLPAPAPSFVEACAGEARAVPGPAAIDTATALLTRLVSEKQAVPLNLMASLTDQPDFVATPEALRWIAAVRADRNWKSAPGGRTAPLVQGVWATLDRAPGRTAAEIREELGRELTEAAVMRALGELWTTLRAVPAYVTGEPTRWSLTRDVYPKEFAAGANTAQTTALSALISLYLHQAVAATSEEAEIFLSPLTARSRIREVLHGMLATRQFGTMALGVQTLLYLEGTLPEFAEEAAASAGAAPEAGAETPSEAKPVRQRAEREPRRDFQRRPRRESQPAFRREPRREQQPRREFGRGPQREDRGERGERREFQSEKKRPFRPGQKPEWHRGPKPERGPEERRAFGKPWQKRGEFRGPREERQAGRESGSRESRDRDARGERKPGGWQSPRRPGGEDRQEGRPERPEFRRENRGGFRPQNREARDNRGPGRPGFARDNRERGERPGKFRREGPGKPKFGRKPGPSEGEARRPDQGAGESHRKGFGKPGSKFRKPAGRFGKPGGFGKSDNRGGKPGPARFGKPGGFGKSDNRSGKPGPARFGKPGPRFGKPSGARFGKSGGQRGPSEGPGERRPWKNRPDKSNPRGPRSGKNRKEQEDKPE